MAVTVPLWTFAASGASSGAMIRAISLALVCAASFAAVYWMTAPDESVTPQSQQSVGPATRGDTAPAAAEGIVALRPGTAEVRAEQSSEATNAVRDVTTDSITAGPVVTGPLVRIAPPHSAEGQPRHEPRLARLYNPIVASAGTIVAGDHDIHLAGIIATEPDQRCGEGATAWPCGRMARAALRNFIRGRAIECEIPAGAQKIPDPARCLVGGDDIAEWLVAQGWAERNGDDYAAQAEAAKEMQRGLFSEGRPDAQDEVAERR